MGIVGDIAKKLEKLREQFKCVINVINKAANGTDLEKKYVEFKAAVNAVFTNDLKRCAQSSGLRNKFKYVAHNC